MQPSHRFLRASPLPRSIPLITTNANRGSRIAFPVWLFLTAFFLFSGIATAAITVPTTPTVCVAPTVGPPTTDLLLAGSGFDPYAAVDIYFDTTDMALVTTDGRGTFGMATATSCLTAGIAVQVPRSAVPGTHWITAVERSIRKVAQKPFLVRTDWAQFQFDPSHTGYNPYENVLTPASVPHIGVRWSYFGGDFSTSAPAVVNGVVYVGNGDGNLYALNAYNGVLLWKYTTGGGVHSSPAVFKGVVYFGSDDGNLYAVNANTGALLWRFAAGGPVGTPAVYSTPNNLAIVYVGCGDGTVYSIKASTGGLLWKYATGASAFYFAPAVSRGVVYVDDEYDHLYAFNAVTGRLLWMNTLFAPGYIRASSVVANGAVYIAAAGGGLQALDANTGAFLWAEDVAALAQPAVDTSVVYAAGAGYDDELVLKALNTSTGAVLWKHVISDESLDYTAASVANGVVYTASFTSGLRAFNASTGDQLWEYNEPSINSFFVVPPVVADGVLYAGFRYNEDLHIGTFHAFDLTGGSYSTSFEPPQRPEPNLLLPDWKLHPSTAVLKTSQQ